MNKNHNLIFFKIINLFIIILGFFFSAQSPVIAADNDHLHQSNHHQKHQHAQQVDFIEHTHKNETHGHDHPHQSDKHEKIQHAQQADFIEHKHENVPHGHDHPHQAGNHEKNQHAKQAGFIEHKHSHDKEHQSGNQQNTEHLEHPHEDKNHVHAEDKNDKEHAHEHEEAELKFSTAELEEFSITLAQAKSGVINKTLDLTGEVIVAPEHLHHVVPRLSGVVRRTFKYLGDKVKTGDLLVTISSRDLADAKAQYVAANSLLQLANTRLNREYNLYKNKVTAKRNYLEAKQAQTEISSKHNAARQQLLSIGLTEKSILSVLRNTDKDLTLYELRAPADGVIIEKHAAIGEAVKTDSRIFTLSNLSQVWVNLTVYQKDLDFIHQGQQVFLNTRFLSAEKQPSIPNTISWISPILDESTRSATARVIIDNTSGQWRPGLFVNAKVNVSSTSADIVIPLSAIQTIKGQTVVFVEHHKGEFEPQVIQLGRKDNQQVEVLQGLKTGQTYVSKNSFSLKAQLQKDSFGHGHSH